MIKTKFIYHNEVVTTPHLSPDKMRMFDDTTYTFDMILNKHANQS